ncbi:helix-turn-helix domain-containing protein [Parabacteroides distasonis]
MEVVTIEKRTFLYICERFTEFAKRIESLCSTHIQKVENWLDSQEVCLLLGFSKRTLQYYRSSGRLAYSQIGSKIYYKSADIEKIISNCEIKNQSPKQITSYEKNQKRLSDLQPVFHCRHMGKR